jgi:aminoglycoside phosphotransferase (APT) family kinase protein
MITDGTTVDGLLAVLRRETGRSDLAFVGEPAPLTGGFWAELLSFRLADAPPGWDGPLVARIMPNADIAAKETAFQAEIARQGYPTPKVHAAGDPEAGVDGRAFLVMDLAAGAPLLSGLDGLAAIARVPSLARRLPNVLAGVLADLHRLDPAPVERALDTAGIDQPCQARMLESLRDTAKALGRPDLADAAAWLEANVPTAETPVLCHGDLHPFNVLVDDTGAVTVLDWSAALIAPPTYDLGFTSLVLAEPPLLVPGPLRPLVRAAGRWLSRRFLRAYAHSAGVRVDPSALRWQHALVCLRALVEVAGWVAAGTIDERGGHPWVIAGDAFAEHLAQLTGAPVTPR